MYIHMLGYPTHFGQMETLKLIAATGFAEKVLPFKPLPPHIATASLMGGLPVWQSTVWQSCTDVQTGKTHRC